MRQKIHDNVTVPCKELASCIQQGEDVVFENWTGRLETAFGEEADLKMRYLLENRKDRKDLFSFLIERIQGDVSPEEQDLGPLFKEVWALDYSISDFFTEISCLEHALSDYLRSIDGWTGTQLADNLELVYREITRIGDAVLKECSQLFEHIAETSRTGFCHTDPDGHIIFANREIQRLTGKASLIGDRFEDLFSGAEKQVVQEAVHVDRQDQAELRQLTLKSANGQTVPVGVEMGPVMIEGQHKGGYAHLTDISRPVEIQNQIFDRSLLGIIKLDPEGNITFANKSLQQLVGMHELRGQSVQTILPDEQTWKFVKGKLDNRISGGASEEYELEVMRVSDKKRIPVMVSAFPEMDLSGEKNVGSFAIVRSIIDEKIHRHIETYRDENSLLTAVAKEIALVIPYDLIAVSEYSSDLQHTRSFFSYKPEGKPTWERRWWEMTPARIKWASESDIIVVDDIEEFFKQPEWVDFRHEPDIEWLFQEGFCSFIFYPIFVEDRLVAAMSLMTKSQCAYETHYQGLIKRLPIDMAILMALYYHRKRETSFITELIGRISRAGSHVKEIARIIVESIAFHYDWNSVSLFKVNEKKGKICLIRQAVSDNSYRLVDGYEQDFDTGVLGWVGRTGEVVNIGDNLTDDRFKDTYFAALPSGPMRSELCLPLTFGEVTWLLNIEDIQLKAFSKEEERAIIRITSEVSAYLEKSSMSHFLEASLATTSDAIVVADGSGNVVQANPSAIEMIGFEVLKDSRNRNGATPAGYSSAMPRVRPTPVRDLFEDTVEADSILRFNQAPSTAIELKRSSGDTVPVLLSMVDLQEDFGYTVFGAADLTTQKRLEEIGNLGKIYFEIATQTKTPLALAYGWLNRLKRRLTDERELDDLDKVIRQLRKLGITYDRLALFADDDRGIPFNRCLLDIAEILEVLKDEMPVSDSNRIDWDYPKGNLFVNGDLFQLRFCFETILAYLLRFVPERKKIAIAASKEGKRITTTINGWNPSFHPASMDTDRAHQTELSRALVDMAFGEKVIEKFMANHGGIYSPPLRDGNFIQFELNLPAAKD